MRSTDGGVATLAQNPLRQRHEAAATSPFVAEAKNGEDLGLPHEQTRQFDMG